MQVKQRNSYSKLMIALAYSAVVVIWSTTPITIKWSGEGTGYLFGIVMRMSIGALLATAMVFLLYRKLPMHSAARKAYLAAATALFGGMLPVYWGAQYISSGLISVIFGFSPIVTGYFAWRFIHENGFSAMKVMGALSGVAGLLVIFSEDMSLEGDYFYGMLSVLSAVIIHALSAVWVKSVKTDIPALALVAGGLLYSMPMFIAVYLLFAPELPDMIPQKALWSILYLGVVGSVLGFVCYYYLLKRLATSSVALITLITPVLALIIGYAFNNEDISKSLLAGTSFVLLGLALHQWGDTLSNKICRKRKHYSG